MAKNISMTRERKQALPVILAAAQKYLEMHHGVGRDKAALERALEAFK